MTETIGCDTRSLLDDAEAERTSERLSRIADLRQRGFDHTHIARIIARRLDEQTAFAVESYLIRSVYGVDSLTNRVEGIHADRFRTRDCDEFIAGFDVDAETSDTQLRGIEARFGRYYVYTLRDPVSCRVFYVGKGNGRRLLAHFNDAAKFGEYASDDGHLPLLLKLIGNGHRSADT